MKIVSVMSPTARNSCSVALLSGALLLISNVLPDRAAKGQSRLEPAPTTGSTAPAERQGEPLEQGEADGLKIFALRLGPGQDLRRELERFTRERGIRAGFIITTVGSLKKTALRLANQTDAASFEGKFEIVSLVGTLSQDGVHLHVSLADSAGRTIGGHLVEGCEIYTTAEIVIGDARGLSFTREADPLTGYQELRIRRGPRSRRRR